jgi:hypothetical protein
LTNIGDIVYGEVEIFIQKNLISCLEKSHKTKSKRRPWDHKSKTAELGATNEEFAQVFFNKDDVSWVKLLWSKYYINGKVPGQTIKGSFW